MYFRRYGDSDRSLDRWGTTLIPPESIKLFIDIIESRTSNENREMNKDELRDLILLLQEAKRQNKFVIHFGV